MNKLNKSMIIPILLIIFLSAFNHTTAVPISKSSENMEYKIFDMPYEFAGTESHAGLATLALLIAGLILLAV